MTIFDILRPTYGDRTPWVDSAPTDGYRCDDINRSGMSSPAGSSDGAAQTLTAQHALGRYRHYRRAFPWAGITCAVETLRQPDIAIAVRKRGHAVDVRSCDELTLALSSGFAGRRIVMHDDGVTSAPLRCAVNAGVGRMVLGCSQQVAVLASCAGGPQRVLVDVSTDCAGDTIAAVLVRPHLDLIGLHARLGPAAHMSAYADTVAEMIARMARIRREQDIILTRVSLAGGGVLSDRTAAPSVLRGLAAELEDAFDEACARYRFPRPALILAPG